MAAPTHRSQHLRSGALVDSTAGSRTRVAAVTSHPIQYQAPWFRALADRFDLEVLFCHRATPDNQAELGYSVGFDWDIDLTAGYSHRFLTNVSRVPGIARFFGCDTPEMHDILAREYFDAVIVNGWHFKSYVQTFVACRRQRIPVLVRTDSQHAGVRPAWKKALKRLLYPRLLNRLDAFLPTGQLAREYLASYGVGAERMFVAPHCVDVDFFDSRSRLDAEARAASRRSLGLRTDALVLLFVGRFIQGKRAGDLLPAAVQLEREGIPTDVLYVGAGPQGEAIRSSAHGLTNRIVQIGFRNQSQLPALYATADILVVPSEAETWGLVVNEAMACGVPVVVSSGVACSVDQVVGTVAGVEYPVGDLMAMQSALRQVHARCHEPGHRARIRAHCQTTRPERAVEGVVQAVRWLTEGTREGGSNGA